MPELPEVQTIVDTLLPRLPGRPILGVRLARLDILTPPGINLPARLTGRSVASVDRRGKRIIFTLDDGNRFYVHLGMTGQLAVCSTAEPLATHTHLVVEFEDRAAGTGNGHGSGPPPSIKHPSISPPAARPSVELRFRDPRRFGGVWWLGREAPDAGMGPEPLRLRPAHLAARLARTTRAVKNALLDQRVVAGLGNIYVDESLFAAGIHPLTPADALSAEQVRRLSRAIKLTLRKAIRHRGSTLRDYRDADGAAGGFQKLHRVYDRAGQKCHRCRASIQRIVLGGRSTHFCSTCQPATHAPESAAG